MAVAQGYWRAAPNCPDGISIQRAQWLPDPNIWAAAVQGGCAVAFDPDFYPAPADYDQGWYQAAMCSVVAHEWGHLLGYGHVADPNNLMNPVTPINIVDGCPTWGLPAATPEPRDPPVRRPQGAAKNDGAQGGHEEDEAGRQGKSRSTKRAKATKRCTRRASAPSPSRRAASPARRPEARAKRH